MQGVISQCPVALQRWSAAQGVAGHAATHAFPACGQHGPVAETQTLPAPQSESTVQSAGGALPPPQYAPPQPPLVVGRSSWLQRLKLLGQSATVRHSGRPAGGSVAPGQLGPGSPAPPSRYVPPTPPLPPTPLLPPMLASAFPAPASQRPQPLAVLPEPTPPLATPPKPAPPLPACPAKPSLPAPAIPPKPLDPTPPWPADDIGPSGPCPESTNRPAPLVLQPLPTSAGKPARPTNNRNADEDLMWPLYP